MKIAVALAIVASLASTQVLAQTKENRTLTEAKTYTDQAVAAERAARQSADATEAGSRSLADNQEAQIRASVDADLQTQIDGLGDSTATPKSRTITVTGAAFELRESRNFQRSEVGAGCRSANGFLTAVLPISEGSKIVGFSASIDDATDPGYGSVRLVVPTDDPAVAHVLGEAKSSSTASGYSKVAATSFSERTLAAGDAIEATFASVSEGLVTDGAAAICRLSVTYIEP